MGIGELIKVVATGLKRWHSAPGNAVNLTGTGLGGAGIEAELFTGPGVFARPVKGARGIVLPIGEGRRYAVVVAVHDYRVNINISEGETAIYSQDSSGVVQARIDLDAAGKVGVSNAAGKDLKVILTALIQHVRDLVTINCVVGAPVTLNPATIATLNADIVELGGILK